MAKSKKKKKKARKKEIFSTWLNPYQLLQKMAEVNIQYGYYDFTTNQPIIYKDLLFDDIDYIHKHCYVLHPKEVWKYKIGTCWDCSMMEWYWLKRIPCISSYVLFIKYDDEDSNHTVVYYHDTVFDKWYIMEYAWYRYMGFYGPYNSREKLFTNYFSNIITRCVSNVTVEVDINNIYKQPIITFNKFWNMCMKDSISYDHFIKRYIRIEL